MIRRVASTDIDHFHLFSVHYAVHAAKDVSQLKPKAISYVFVPVPPVFGLKKGANVHWSYLGIIPPRSLSQCHL